MQEQPDKNAQELERERDGLLYQLESWLEMPMIILAFVWLVLLLVEFVWGTGPFLGMVFNTIWAIFILEFLLRFTLAPRKLPFLRRTWLTVISLVLPAARVFQLARAIRMLSMARAVRGMHMVRVVGSINRGMNALRASMGRRGFGYVAALSLIVLLAGSAGMYIFESDLPDGQVGFENYGEALWWTAMLLTTVASEYWPQTPEGRFLTFLLSLYALGILGYVTATLASFFVGRDAADETGELPNAQSIQELHAEITALRTQLQQMTENERAK
jgi:voltage-gated potassium channel